MAQTGNSYQPENTYGRDGREYLNRKNMAQTGDGRLLSIRKNLRPRQKRIFEQEKYGADRRQFLIRNYLWPRQKRIFEQEKYGEDRRQLLIRKHIWPRQ
jgi:hypothetical protein